MVSMKLVFDLASFSKLMTSQQEITTNNYILSGVYFLSLTHSSNTEFHSCACK